MQREKGKWNCILKILSTGLTLLALKSMDALLVALRESRIGSVLWACEDHVHDHLRILSVKSVDSFPLIVVYIGLSPVIASKGFEKQDDYLTLIFFISIRCIVSWLSLIYWSPTTMYVLVTVRSNLITWANHNYWNCSHLHFQDQALELSFPNIKTFY